MKTNEILKKADYLCIPQIADFKWDLEVYYADGFSSTSRFLAKKQNKSKFMFYTFYPNKNFGNVYLRIDNDIWEYFLMADIVQRSSMQNNILNSNITFFDILFDDLIEFYDAQITGNKIIEVEGKDVDCIVLSLHTSKKQPQGYPNVLLYIDSKTNLPAKREYYSQNNVLLKVIYFYDYEFKNSKINAFTFKSVSTTVPDEYTIAKFYDIDEKSSMENKYFTIAFLQNWIPKAEDLR
ncbi:MAG: outer membrane lipoprotein-sorting protein [Treponemataceae bacterium]|nr:outer membrane lipoprotein-sorting protein [Treponemataceae bacterium]